MDYLIAILLYFLVPLAHSKMEGVPYSESFLDWVKWLFYGTFTMMSGYLLWAMVNWFLGGGV